MAEYCSVRDFFQMQGDLPIVDVRSPSEFELGHIPGSHNVPILDDEQRALVGTTYKQKGKYEAIELGFELAGPELIDKIREAKKIARDKRLLLYCWRGGMRSRNMAWLMEANGLSCSIIEGGYKAFRQEGKALFASQQYKSIVLGGFTGSNKTLVLHEMAKMGEQVLDIEALARHRGSSFGRIGLEDQLSNEQFENQLIWEWMAFDPAKRIWLEDESKIMGSNHIPEELYQSIRNASVIKLEIDKVQRAKNLVDIYGGLNDAELEKAIVRIGKKLGGKNMNLALEALKEKDYQKVAELSLSYYDKTYKFGLSKRDPGSIYSIHTTDHDPKQIAQQIIKKVEKIS
jgi:tRNA 2-selenouridine synthase